jgi:hypothetical protein
MPVSPEGGCNAFRGGAAAAPNTQDDDGPDMDDDADLDV